MDLVGFFFFSQVTNLGVCIAFHRIIPKNRQQAEILSIISVIRLSGAKVILVFAVEQDAAALFDEVQRCDTLVLDSAGNQSYTENMLSVLLSPSLIHTEASSLGYSG